MSTKYDYNSGVLKFFYTVHFISNQDFRTTLCPKFFHTSQEIFTSDDLRWSLYDQILETRDHGDLIETF